MKIKTIILLLLIGVSGFIGCKNKESANQEIKPVKSVKVVKLDQSNNEGHKIVTATVKESGNINLGFKVAGKIDKILYKEGDFVKQGDLIAEMDNSDYKLKFDAAEAQYEQVNKEAGRVEELHKRGSATGNDYDKAVAGRKLVDAQLEGAKSMLEGTRITAPFSGYIQKVFFSSGEMLDAGMPVVEMINIDKLELEAYIPASLYILAPTFKSVQCTFDIIPNDNFPVQIISINPKANNSQLYKMRLSFNPAQSKRIAPGMTAQIEINYKKEKNINISIPLTSLFNENNKNYVWILNDADSIVNKREVIISGFDKKGNAIVTSGLEGGENIVIAGVNYINEEEKVKVLQPPSSTNIGGLL